MKALRVKTRPHVRGRRQSLDEKGEVVAGICWRLGERSLLNMQERDFDVRPGQQAWAMMAEEMACCIHLLDRLAFARTDDGSRATFITAAARRIGDLLELNIAPVTGESGGGYRAQFLELVNRRAADYGPYGLEQDGAASFAFSRVLANVFADLASDRDRSWVYDQVMEVEVPEIMRVLSRTMGELFDGQGGA